MKKKSIITVTISASILIIVALLSLFYFTRPIVEVVLSEAEELLIKDALPQGLFEKIRFKAVSSASGNADFTIYTPYTYASADIVNPSAVYGLLDEDIETDIRFTPNSQSMWELSYEENQTTLLTAVLYDENDEEELALIETVPAYILRYPYEDELSRVGSEELLKKLSADGVSRLIIYSPNKTMRLFEEEQGLSLVMPLLYMGAFEDSSSYSFVGVDYASMAEALIAGERGSIATPYKLYEAKESLEVFFNCLF